MKTLLPLFLLVAQPAMAQYESRIQYNAAALRTHLSNASDNASGIVDSRPQIMPAGGFTFSRVNGAKSGFQGFHIGVGYLAYKQTTYAESNNLADPLRPKTFTSSQLHYLSLPAEVRFGKAARRGITPFVTGGLYLSRLLSSKECVQEQLFVKENGDYFQRHMEIENRNITIADDYQGYAVSSQKSKLTRSIYNSFNWGVMASVGADFALGKAHFLSVRIPVRYSLNDAERKEAFGFSDKPIWIPRGDYYWNYNSPKGISPYQKTNGGQERSTTHLFFYGLEISYGFRLLRISEDGEPAR